MAMAEVFSYKADSSFASRRLIFFTQEIEQDVSDEHPFLRHAAGRKNLGTINAVRDELKENVPVANLSGVDFMLNPRPASIDAANAASRELAGSCTETTVDFWRSASGKRLQGGDYVDDEWKELGLTLSSEGGYGTLPRLFDTRRVGNKYHGDTDLGSPNQRCRGGGPGIGEGGEPDTKGANCEYLGNVLIIQEDNDDKSIPDDNAEGGKIHLDFEGQTVYKIGLLDVDYDAFIRIQYRPEPDKIRTKDIVIPLLGDNSFQTIAIDTPNVVRLSVIATRSAAVAFVTFCPKSDATSPPPPPPPPSPPLSESKDCVTRVIDFSDTAAGARLRRGQYVANEWEEYGLKLSSSGGFGTKPRVFDTANPGKEKAGDPDLGSPNEHCRNGGPGRGDGGKPGSLGANCKALGNVLIIQEPGNSDMSIPDDNVKGGAIKFDFAKTTKAFVFEIGLLDVDYECYVDVVYHIGNTMAERTIDVPLLGDNSFQKVPINMANVKHISVRASRSAAVTHISFCSFADDGEGKMMNPPTLPFIDPPTPPPVDPPTPSPVDPPTPPPVDPPTPPPVDPPIVPPVDPPTTPPPVDPPTPPPVDPETPPPTPAPTPFPTSPPVESPTPPPTPGKFRKEIMLSTFTFVL